MFEFGRNTKIILYDEETMKCFGGRFLRIAMEQPDYIDATVLEDANQGFIRGISKATVEMTCELSHEIIQLDPTTMKRIAKHNLEKENEGLLKEIEKNKKEIEGLKELYKTLQERLQAISDIGSDIWENGAEYEKENDDYGF